MKRRFQPIRHGASQPSVASANSQLAGIIAMARDLETLDPVAMARMYRANLRDVEYQIGVERRRRAERE